MDNYGQGSGRRVDGRQRLLKAASILFAQGGFETVSVAQILELSDLKAPSLYHHFRDKEGLYVQWALETLKMIGERAQRSEKTPVGLANVILDGATIDLLQLSRDLQALNSDDNRDQIVNSLRRNVMEPAMEVLRTSGEYDEDELYEGASFFLHAVMYAHPAYARQRSGTRINGRIVSWIVERAVR
jgi:AcrR family transcriptional regulator